MQKILILLLAFPIIVFGQTSWIHCDSSFSININSQNSIEVVYSVSGPNLNVNSNPSWVYFNMLGSCIGGSSYNSQTDTVNINNNLPDSTAIMCLITDSLSSCIVIDTLVYDSFTGWSMTSNSSSSTQTYVPDDNFESYLEANGMGNGVPNDDYVTTANINTITYLPINTLAISNLTGIEDFSNLEELLCYDNNLSTLNLNQNINLKDLSCGSNNLTSLLIDSCLNLEYISCPNNFLTSLDVSNNFVLNELRCYQNNLTTLDLSNNTNLIEVQCGDNYLSYLNTNNCSSLLILNCCDNILTSINLNSNTSLTDLYCYNNNLDSLNIISNTLIERIYCQDNSLTQIDASNNIFLQHLQCYTNNITQLDLTNCNFLENLHCGSNQINSLDVTNNPYLKNLTCDNNNLTSLDISNNTYLEDLYCEVNNIDSLDLTNNLNLDGLNCGDNNLTFLDLRNGNNSLITSYTSWGNPHLYCVNVDDTSWSYIHWTSIDSWTVFSTQCNYEKTYVPDDNFENYLENNNMGDGVFNNDSVLTQNINTVAHLNVSYNNILDLTGIEDFTALIHLGCYNNIITSLDLSNNSALTELYCVTNNLTSLDLRNGNNTNITTLWTSGNPNLTCISVDDPVYSDTNWLNSTSVAFSFDGGHYFSSNCSLVYGCTDTTACNYNPLANTDDGSCLTNYGCLDASACNYDPTATCADGFCVYINVSFSISNVSCNGFADGSVVATANGGATPNYQYSLGGGLSQASGTFSNLTVGTYFIDVTDINGCSSSQTFTITEPNPLFVNTFSTDISCSGYCDGSAFSMPSGGTPPYSYLWSSGSTTDNISSLCSGSYVVNITDANNCVNIETVIISEPLPLVSNNTINGCDSVLIGINYYTISGTYTDTLTSVNGCDSVVNTNLTIEQNTSSYDTLSVTASIVWNGMPLNVSGDYSETLINSLGCDSIAYLNLTVTSTGVLDFNGKKEIVKLTNMLGQEIPYRKNTPLFYIYDDGTVEKKIVVE